MLLAIEPLFFVSSLGLVIYKIWFILLVQVVKVPNLLIDNPQPKRETAGPASRREINIIKFERSKPDLHSTAGAQ